jgi:hypothetical protein
LPAAWGSRRVEAAPRGLSAWRPGSRSRERRNLRLLIGETPHPAPRPRQPLHWKIIYDHAMKRMFTVGLLLTLSLSLLRAQPPRFSDQDSSLRDVKSFEVVIENIQKNAPGLTPDDFRTDVELRCRQAGIRLGNTPGVYLYVNVGLQELFYANGRSEGVYGLSIQPRIIKGT